jgi:(1->4)-alpha-D-glucan 1-alpha-D-glucosylmutase
MPPIATYRVQLTPQFTLNDAAELVPYLAKLGVDHLYTSPSLQAMPGSMSGYDVTNPAQINAELGGQAGHHRLSRQLMAYGLRRMVDIVPNHMAITGNENPWWNDVLKNGRSSRYAAWFDVDWDASDALWPNRVLLPVLGDQFGRVLEAGDLRLSHKQGRFTLQYHDLNFPIDLVSCATLLNHAAMAGGLVLLQFLAEELRDLPRPSISIESELARRQRNLDVLEGLLTRLCREQPEAVEAIDNEVERLNHTLQELGELLEAQHYRLAYWQAADFDLGYRRFFNINELAGLRVELREVFDSVQALPLQWIRDGEANALRVDHPDGLRNPTQYFQALRAAAPGAWIVAEKILAQGETLPQNWPVEGTTGYEFANLVQGLFVAPDGEAPLTRWYEEFSGRDQPFAEQMFEAKQQVMARLLGSEITRLTSLLRAVCERHWRHRDHPHAVLSQLLVNVIGHFTVYRTYVQSGVPASDEDRYRIAAAIAGARAQAPTLDAELLQFLEQLLLMEIDGALEQEFALRFQQLTSPVMAKGVEDTLLYRYHRLSALNEVGGAPEKWGTTLDEFHTTCKAMTQRPYSMLATSTHDTKRSEDVRARLLVLSELPQQWIAATRAWHQSNLRRHDVGLDPDTEYLYYQTLVGAWPIEPERMHRYMEKAVRESKVHTEWTQVNADYEERLHRFIQETFEDAEFLAAIAGFVAKIVVPGRINSLVQTLIKLTAPGVPDLYQGCELWDLSLCDPDNRRPVDFALRQQLLDELDTLNCSQVMHRLDEGLPKLWLIREALRVRRELPDCFGAEASYAALRANGEYREHVVAFGRGAQVLTVAPRLWAQLPKASSDAGEWGETRLPLPRGTWRNRLSPGDRFAGEVPLSQLLKHAPFALLVKDD